MEGGQDRKLSADLYNKFMPFINDYIRHKRILDSNREPRFVLTKEDIIAAVLGLIAFAACVALGVAAQ